MGKRIFIARLCGKGKGKNMENAVTQATEGARKKVIMVDDVSFLLVSAKERLKERYEIFPATSAEALFKILEKLTPDIILLDINMPDTDGFKIIETLKADEKLAQIPVIFLSSKNDKASMTKAKNLGAVDFLTKPFNDAMLVESLEYQLDPEKRNANKPLILAIDDNPSILKSINNALHNEYAVRTLAKPENLKMLLELITPDLFLLDCKMPVMHGFDLIPIIRDYTGHEETPIIFLTSEITVDNITVAINNGATDFIAKPINDDILREKAALHLKDFIIKRRIRNSKF